MMWVVYIGMLLAICWIGFRIYQRSIDAEMHSGKNWFMQRAPFSKARRNNRNGSVARSKMNYDPEADYETLEVFLS